MYVKRVTKLLLPSCPSVYVNFVWKLLLFLVSQQVFLCFSRRAESNVTQLENDSKRLRVELQTSRQGEQELRSTMHSLMASERSTKVELQQLKSECEVIQQK